MTHRSLIVVLIPFFSLGLFNCSAQKTEEKNEGSEWPELDEFHMVMAESFHPYMDSANIEPAKQLAPEMLQVMKKWKTAKLPKRVNNDNTKAKLQGLYMNVEKLSQSVTNSSDEELGKLLTTIHDQFHQLQEIWYTK